MSGGSANSLREAYIDSDYIFFVDGGAVRIIDLYAAKTLVQHNMSISNYFEKKKFILTLSIMDLKTRKPVTAPFQIISISNWRSIDDILTLPTWITVSAVNRQLEFVPPRDRSDLLPVLNMTYCLSAQVSAD